MQASLEKYQNKEHNDRLIAFLVNQTFTQYSSIDKDNSSTLEKIESTIKFLSDFDFTKSDISDDEFADLIQMLIEDQDVYSHHKYDIGKTKHKFHIPLKKDATFKKQRPSKIPVHLRDKLDKLMDEIIQAGIVRELNEKDDMNSWFVSPVIILPKKDYVKLVLDARYLNSITDTSNCSCPLEPLQILMTRINESYLTSSDLFCACAYHQVPLTDEAQKLTSFIVGGRQYTDQVAFYGLKPLPNFFSKLMRYTFGPLNKGKNSNYLHRRHSVTESQNKNKMFDTIREYHSLLRKANLKAAPDKTFFFLRKVKFLGHVVSKYGLSPIASRIDDIKKLKSPESKTEVLGVLGVMGFYSTYIINFHVDAKCLYELANSNDKFQWLPCYEEVFQKLKDKFCHDISNAIPNVNYPFHIHADSSNVGTGCILTQDLPEGKRIVSANFRVFDKAEQKMSTQHRELCGIISALKTYEFYIIGSPFSLYLYCDHRHILFIWSRKGQLSHRLFKYQVVLTKFNNLKILYTPGSNLAFPDFLSRNVPIADIKKYQLEHKTIPNDIKIILDNGEQICYSVLHKDNNNIFQNDCYPVIAQVQDKFCHDISNAIPNVNYPFHIHADSSNVGTGCILTQDLPEGKRIVSANFRVFDKAEQKMSTQHRELCGIISALKTYEFYIIGSPFPLYLYCDHRHILFIWSRKGQLSHRLFKYQVVLTKFNNLKIMYTPGSNLAFPDFVSQNVPIADIKKYQLEHKTIRMI